MSDPILAPRLRVNRSATMTITTTFQRIDFSGSSALNLNSFPNLGVTPMVSYDSVNKLFKFNHDNGRDYNYTSVFGAKTTVTILTVLSSLQYRFVIPNGVSAGVDFYFPYPDSVGYADLGVITAVTDTALNPAVLPIYTNTAMRTNGVGIDVRISTPLALTATCTSNDINFLIYANGVLGGS